MDLYEDALRQVLFRLSADTAHDLGKLALRSPLARIVADRGSIDERLRTDLAGLEVRNPIGLAPGFDKSGDLVPGLARLGFGFIGVGSITIEPRTGNPRPWLHRYPSRQSVANCMGMPNPGLDATIRILARPRPSGTPVIAGVAGFNVDDLLTAAARIEPYVDAVEIGLVCRHTPETFDMAELPTFVAIAEGMARQKTKPAFAKLPPHHTPAERARTLSMVDVCLSGGFDGISLNGTRAILAPALSMGRGGLAGRATTDDALRILDDVAGRAGGRLAIKAAGGVFDGRDAFRFLEHGATAVELYSGFVYRGWAVARKIARELIAELDTRHLARVGDIQRAVQAAVVDRAS
jgi:dihydroorotate dehydrogenase (fumarate)/dihydroorotate dehydrogenase